MKCQPRFFTMHFVIVQTVAGMRVHRWWVGPCWRLTRSRSRERQRYITPRNTVGGCFVVIVEPDFFIPTRRYYLASLTFSQQHLMSQIFCRLKSMSKSQKASVGWKPSMTYQSWRDTANDTSIKIADSFQCKAQCRNVTLTQGLLHLRQSRRQQSPCNGEKLVFVQ